MIKLEDVTKVYAMGQVDVVALDGIDLEIQRGEFISIMGPSGSGKSTLLHILGALMRRRQAVSARGCRHSRSGRRELSRIRNSTSGSSFRATTSSASSLRLKCHDADDDASCAKAKAPPESQSFCECRDGPPPQPLPESAIGRSNSEWPLRALANRPTLILADEPTGNLSSVQGGEISTYCVASTIRAPIVMVTHLQVGSYARRLIAEDGGSQLTNQSQSASLRCPLCSCRSRLLNDEAVCLAMNRPRLQSSPLNTKHLRRVMKQGAQ